MTTKQLEQKIKELEKRILVLETQKQIVNVYPGYQIQSSPIQNPQFTPITGPWRSNGTLPNNNTMPLTTC